MLPCEMEGKKNLSILDPVSNTPQAWFYYQSKTWLWTLKSDITLWNGVVANKWVYTVILVEIRVHSQIQMCLPGPVIIVKTYTHTQTKANSPTRLRAAKRIQPISTELSSCSDWV